MGRRPLGEWIYLVFVEKRTTCIGSLVYYPFWVIALLILSRSTIFADYSPNLAILIARESVLVSYSAARSCFGKQPRLYETRPGDI